jgi:hypothetical protein
MRATRDLDGGRTLVLWSAAAAAAILCAAALPDSLDLGFVSTLLTLVCLVIEPNWRATPRQYNRLAMWAAFAAAALTLSIRMVPHLTWPGAIYRWLATTT